MHGCIVLFVSVVRDSAYRDDLTGMKLSRLYQAYDPRLQPCCEIFVSQEGLEFIEVLHKHHHATPHFQLHLLRRVSEIWNHYA